jgi:hypothetical protein
LEPVHVGGAEAELAGPWLEEHMRGVGFRQLVGDDLRPVRGAVVDDYELPVEVPAGKLASECEATGEGESHISVKVRLRSQVMMGRLRRSL